MSERRVVIQVPPTFWYCPNCDVEDMTRIAGPHTQYHTCAGMNGFTAPMVERGVKAQVIACEREDYVGKDLVRTDDEGRPIMAVRTVRDDGEDCVVYAPTVAVKLDMGS